MKHLSLLLLWLLFGMANAQNRPVDSLYLAETKKTLWKASEVNNSKTEIRTSYEFAQKLSRDGNYLEAIKQLREIIRVADEIGDRQMTAKAYGQLGFIHARQASYSVAVEHYLSALKINEERGDKTGVFYNLVNISSLQADQKDRESALQTIRKAFLLAKEAGDSLQMTTSLINLGNFSILSDKPTSLNYFRQALSMAQNSHTSQRVIILTKLGSLYTDQREFGKATAYLEEAMELARKLELKRSYGEIWSKTALLYFAQQQYAPAIDYAKKAFHLAVEMNLLELKKESYKQLSEFYAATGSFHEAYDNQVQYKLLSDSIFNDKNVRKIAFLESTYRYDKERQVYEKEKANQALKIDNQQRTILFLVILSILILMLAFAVYWTNKLKKRVLKLQIANMNQELEINQKAMAAATLKLMENSERDAHSVKMLENIKKNTIEEGRNEIRTLIAEYKFKSSNTNWKEFEILFQKVNSSFYEKLSAYYPNLTPNERKLCVFLKLNMSNNHISQITFQSEEALKKARLRLRRKMAIDRDTNLATYVQNL
ncbi:MAG: tetratricopeptide repeat protein [Bacteroides sp.]|uniref:tetratricopeptide repeat protein n=1 Tax=Bacteroides sp. TaxID=29523 RepID=UPI002FC6825E